MQLEFVPVKMPDDSARLIDFLCHDDWPFHGRRRLSAEDVAGMAFASPDVESFWTVDHGKTAGLLRLLDLGDIGEGAPQFDLRLASSQRGRGVGASATRWVVERLFASHLDCHRIEANTRSDNIAMQRALLSAGFVHEGTLRDAWRHDDGDWSDSMVYGLLRREWRAD